jgi:hypothetical protein
MGFRFNPAPGWPTPPPGGEPKPGSDWQPDPSWPPPPPGWQLWVDDVPPRDETVAPRPALGYPPVTADTGGATRVAPSRSETVYLARATSQHERLDQRFTMVASAVTAVCFTYFTNTTTALMGRHTLVWVAFITIGGLGIALLFRYVLTPARGRAVAAKLSRRNRVPHSEPLSASPGGISGASGSAAPDDRDRRVTRVLAAIAASLLLVAFLLLQLTLSVTVVTAGILALIVGITFLPSGWVARGAQQVLFKRGQFGGLHYAYPWIAWGGERDRESWRPRRSLAINFVGRRAGRPTPD